MALAPSAQYPAQTDVDPAYPHGKARNAGTFQDGSGTPLEKSWINDLWGFEQALLAAAGITPSGTPDASGASDYLDAVTYLAEQSSEGAALANWSAQTSGIASLISGIAWSGTLFVAVCSAGTIITSPDGITWTTRTSGTANDLNEVAWSGTLFVAVGFSGTVITSSNGITWTTRTSGTANILNAVAWSGTLFVAVGAAGTIITSPDGITWTTRTSGTANTLLAVAWSAALFVATGAAGTILTSPDGITWTTRTHPKGGFGANVFAVFRTARHWVAAGVWTIVSTDALTWRVGEATATVLAAGAWDGQGAILGGNSGTILRSHRILA